MRKRLLLASALGHYSPSKFSRQTLAHSLKGFAENFEHMPAICHLACSWSTKRNPTSIFGRAIACYYFYARMCQEPVGKRACRAVWQEIDRPVLFQINH